MYMYMCVYIYIYICIHTHTYTHKYIHTYTYIVLLILLLKQVITHTQIKSMTQEHQITNTNNTEQLQENSESARTDLS